MWVLTLSAFTGREQERMQMLEPNPPALPLKPYSTFDNRLNLSLVPDLTYEAGITY